MKVADAVVLVAAEDYDHHVRVTHTDTSEVTNAYFFKGDGQTEGWTLAETPSRATFLTLENPYMEVVSRFVRSMELMDAMGVDATVEILKGDV